MYDFFISYFGGKDNPNAIYVYEYLKELYYKNGITNPQERIYFAPSHNTSGHTYEKECLDAASSCRYFVQVETGSYYNFIKNNDKTCLLFKEITNAFNNPNTTFLKVREETVVLKLSVDDVVAFFHDDKGRFKTQEFTYDSGDVYDYFRVNGQTYNRLQVSFLDYVFDCLPKKAEKPLVAQAKKEVFVSYSHYNTDVAEEIMSYLVGKGINCLDVSHSHGDENILRQDIESCPVFVVLVSEASNGSPKVKAQLKAASLHPGTTIIAVMLDDDLELAPELDQLLKLKEIFKTHGQDAEACLERLFTGIATILDPKPTQKAPESLAQQPAMRMAKYEEMLKMGYSASSIAERLVHNDYLNCEGIDTANEGDPGQWARLIAENSETFQYLLNENDEIVGNWSITSIDDELAEKALRGELLEGEDITIDTVFSIGMPDVYNCYILNFSLNPDYRNATNRQLIIESFIHQLDEYSEAGVLFKRFIINCFNIGMEKIVKQMGFKFVKENKVFGKVYCLEMKPYPTAMIFTKGHERMRQEYEANL